MTTRSPYSIPVVLALWAFPVPSGAVDLAGSVQSYATALIGQEDPIAGAAVSIEDSDPPIAATADAAGDYVLGGLPEADANALVVSPPTALPFRRTRNEGIRAPGPSSGTPLYLLARPDLQRWYTTATGTPLAPSPDADAVLVIDLRRDDGTPLVDLAPEDMALFDEDGTALSLDPVANGPYFFGPSGDPGPREAIPRSQSHHGTARAVLFHLPAGRGTLLLQYLDGQGHPTRRLLSVTTLEGGVTLARAGDDGAHLPPPGGVPGFAADIFPRLQKASRGGLGCANCHTQGGLASLLQFDGAPEQVLQALTARPGVVDPTSAAVSLLLSKPLFEDPPNHPTATFASPQDADYQTILRWISGGALP